MQTTPTTQEAQDIANHILVVTSETMDALAVQRRELKDTAHAYDVDHFRKLVLDAFVLELDEETADQLYIQLSQRYRLALTTGTPSLALLTECPYCSEWVIYAHRRVRSYKELAVAMMDDAQRAKPLTHPACPVRAEDEAHQVEAEALTFNDAITDALRALINTMVEDAIADHLDNDPHGDSS